MKTLFVPAESKTAKLSNLDAISKKLPLNIAITYSIQFKELAEQVKSELEKDHEVTLFEQVLGCSNPNVPNQTQALLLIGQGRFHAIGVALGLEPKIPIYVYEQGKLTEISNKEVSDLEKKKKAAYLKYLHAEKLGILITTKPGQNRTNRAIKIKNKINSKKDKKSYLFIGNNINTQEFENFPEIQSWVNTACPRMDMNDPSIMNIADLEKLE